MNEIKINIREATHEIRRMNRDLNKSTLDAAIVAALNHTIRSGAFGRGGASQEIRKAYKLKARDVNKRLKIKKAYKGNLESAVIALGRPIGLISFGARQRRDGVSVNVMGERKVVKKAFIATMKSGHKGVFGRGMYMTDGKFRFRKKRVALSHRNDVPISELKSASIPTALMNDAVLRNVEKKLLTAFPKRLTHEVSRRRT